MKRESIVPKPREISKLSAEERRNAEINLEFGARSVRQLLIRDGEALYEKLRYFDALVDRNALPVLINEWDYNLDVHQAHTETDIVERFQKWIGMDRFAPPSMRKEALRGMGAAGFVTWHQTYIAIREIADRSIYNAAKFARFLDKAVQFGMIEASLIPEPLTPKGVVVHQRNVLEHAEERAALLRPWNPYVISQGGEMVEVMDGRIVIFGYDASQTADTAAFGTRTMPSDYGAFMGNVSLKSMFDAINDAPSPVAR